MYTRKRKKERLCILSDERRANQKLKNLCIVGYDSIVNE
jgi:hypothetical protein